MSDPSTPQDTPHESAPSPADESRASPAPAASPPAEPPLDAAATTTPSRKPTPSQLDEAARLRRFLKRAAIFTVLAVVILHALLWSYIYLEQDTYLYPRDVVEIAERPIHDSFFLTRDIGEGEPVEAILLPGRAASAQSPAPLVVFLHGNAESVDEHVYTVNQYVYRGFAVLLPEYRGYNRSGGTPSQAGIREDVLAFIEQAVDLPQVDGSRVIYHGRSLGGAIAADLATHRQPAALILESTFTSTAAMARAFRAPGFLFNNPYRTLDALETVDVPTLLFHGQADEVVPIDHAHDLQQAGPHVALVTFETGTHNAMIDNNADIVTYWSSIFGFLGEHDIYRGSPPPPTEREVQPALTGQSAAPHDDVDVDAPVAPRTQVDPPVDADFDAVTASP